MSDDFEQIQSLAGALLRQLGASERRSLLRRMARQVQQSQSARIGRQEAPDGSKFAPRRERRELKPGNYAVKFLYPKGDANARVVFLKSWVHDGPLMTGFDIEAGGIRSFFYDKVEKYLPVDAGEQNAGAGKLRRKGTIRQKAMFRKLRSARNLRAGSTDREAWIGFSGRAAEIARVHQEGLRDKPSRKGRAVRYAERGLLGVTQAEQSRALDMLLEHVAAA
ncbi:phage virion morphogenesis protein [Sphingomonas sp. Leaf38]|uniref:phage virion morphogenesis protein n=1 Tax=Sphingomonas sp. Leaf38 TaxID=1736217 RepID=UPI0007020024|nr:phage virion morphogenesis protein [Sphingomonas sp. Leaf38]KQN29708.1 phage morphogenesis protein [Sphingomonas sp. Leaf38]